MPIRFVILLITGVLLVPFVYGISFIPDVCAVDPAPGYLNSNTCGAKTTNPETGVTQQTCCWKERTGTSQAPGPEKIVCQTCRDTDKVGAGLVGCSAPVTQAAGPLKPELSGTLDEGNILEGNATGRLPGSGIFKVLDTNLTFSQTNNSSDTSTLGELQSDVENDAEENNEETHEEGQQDQSEESEDSNEEEEEE